jgi:hypothetical protein
MVQQSGCSSCGTTRLSPLLLLDIEGLVDAGSRRRNSVVRRTYENIRYKLYESYY